MDDKNKQNQDSTVVKENLDEEIKTIDNPDSPSQEELDDLNIKDGISKIDAIDQAETPSRTKISSIISHRKPKRRRDKNGGFTDEDGMYHEKKVGLIALTSHYFIKWWPYGLAVILLTILASLATAAGPWVMQQMIIAYQNQNLGVGKTAHWDIKWTSYIWIQVGFFAIIAITTMAGNMIAGFIGKWIEIDLRNRSAERLITQDISYYSNKKIGEILTKVTSDTQIIGDQVQGIPVAFISAVFTTIFSLVFMFIIDWKISLIAIGLFLIIILSIVATFGGLKKLMLKVRDTITRINGTVLNRISTVQLIKTTGTEDYEKKSFDKLHNEYLAAYKKMIMMQSLVIMFLLVGINSIQVILTAATVGIYINEPEVLVDVLPSMVLAVGVMIGPMMQLVRVVSGIVIASASAQRIATIVDSKSRINPHLRSNEGIWVDKLTSDIVLRNVVFAYPEKPEKVIIPNFNYTFEKGKKYAFVGETGSGKSTISKLLLRFYDPTLGEVLINEDINLKDVNLPSYLKHVGYVEQEPSLFLGNVYENVKYGTDNATNEQVIEACKKADMHKLIMSWPDGYDTVLGERGFLLSGGQKQRLVIARMFLKDPQLLILDEATSALDNIVEKEIQAQLEKLMVGRTTISIAHRLSTIKNADEIIVLGAGKGIVETGTFNELKSRPGHFKKLYEAGLMK